MSVHDGRPDVVATAARWTFVAAVVLLPVMQPFVTVGGVKVIAADVAFAACVATVLAAAVTGRLSVRPTSALAAFGAFVVVGGITLATGGIDRASLGGAATAAYVAGLAALAVLVVPAVVTARQLTLAFVAGSALAVAGALVGAGLFYAGRDTPTENRFIGTYGSVPAGRFPRVNGLFTSPNLLANFLILGVAMLLVAASCGWLPRRTVAALACGGAIAAGFTLSLGIGGICLGVALWFLVSDTDVSRTLRLLVVAAGLAGAVVFAALSLVQLDVAEGLQRSDRVAVWSAAWHVFADHPLTGRGFDENLVDVAVRKPSGGVEHLTDAHDVWLSVGGQEGLLGVAALVAVFAVPFVDRDRRARLRTDPVARALAIALVAAVGYQGLGMSVEDTRHVWLALGALAGLLYQPCASWNISYSSPVSAQSSNWMTPSSSKRSRSQPF